jgi:hypothetical protein
VSPTQPQRGKGGLALAGAGIALVALLLLAGAPRDALVARGVVRLVSADLEQTLAREPGEQPNLFAAVSRLSRPAAGAIRRATAHIVVDGLPAERPAIERGVESQWNLFRERRGAGLPPLEFGAEPDASSLQLELFVTTSPTQVALRARVSRAALFEEVVWSDAWRLPGRASLLPPLLAVGMALVFGRTLLALFVGIWVGAMALAWPEWGLVAPLRGLWDVFAVYLVRELVDSFRLEILGFILALVALVGVVGRGGGLHGLVERALRVVRGPRSGQALTSALGLLMFFDDYANCVLVGNTMRPLTDRLRISREKLAYLVDSTAAPVAALSLLSTWIAFQVSVYSSQLPAVGISVGGYALFIESLPLRFYCVFALMLVFGVAVSGRDFGPMARAEARARLRGELVRPGGRPLVDSAVAQIEPAEGMLPDWRMAAIPFAVTIAVTGWRIFADGGGFDALDGVSLEALGRILLEGSGSGPIFGGALAGLACAVFLVAGPALRWGVALGTLAAVGVAGGLLSGFAAFVAECRARGRSASPSFCCSRRG